MARLRGCGLHCGARGPHPRVGRAFQPDNSDADLRKQALGRRYERPPAWLRLVPPSVEPVKVEPGEEVKFEAIAHDDWGQDLTAETKWTWDFGDGHTSNQNPVWHVFKSGGSFTVTVTGRCGGEEASDRIVCLQDPAEGWSLRCSIQIIEFWGHHTKFLVPR